MWAVMASFVAGTAEAKKTKAPPPPLEGWQPAGINGGTCYHPPQWDALPIGARKEARQKALEALLSQWRGERGDGVSFPGRVAEDIETAILAKMERIEFVTAENVAKCAAAMAAGSTQEWGAWLVALPGRLTEGECPYPPLDYTMYDYLNINSDWQFTGRVCKGDRVKIKGSEMDYYQIEPKGVWINAKGDSSRATTGPYACNVEGCFAGMLIARYTSETGVTQILPVGLSLDFLVPDHGRLEVMINDTEFTDNRYKIEGRLEHHMAIEYSPVK
jgi:hypothetical protein